MLGGKFTIDSTGNFPSDDGFSPGGNFIGSLTGGTTIAATLQKKNGAGNWVTVPNDSGLSTIDDAWEHEVKAAADDLFRFNVTDVSGSWDFTHKPVR